MHIESGGTSVHSQAVHKLPTWNGKSVYSQAEHEQLKQDKQQIVKSYLVIIFTLIDEYATNLF